MIHVNRSNRDSGSDSTRKGRVPRRDYSTAEAPTRRSHNALGVIAALTAGLFACSGAAEERAEQALDTKAGTPVATLISSVGAATREREIYRAHPGDPCASDKRNVRAFEYHVPIDPVSGPVRKLFGGPTFAAMTVVCLDADSKVVSTHSLKF
jgi:hypothetical protein